LDTFYSAVGAGLPVVELEDGRTLCDERSWREWAETATAGEVRTVRAALGWDDPDLDDDSDEESEPSS
jgi:hypothetical protein